MVARFLFLSLFLSLPIPAKAIDQDNHRRILFLEDWNGSYLVSTVSKSQNTARFEACDVKEKHSCELVGKVKT